MYDNFNYLMSKVPYILKATHINQVVLKSIAKTFNIFDYYLDLIDNYWLIDKAKGGFLDDLGVAVEVPRNNDVDEDYRLRIKLAYQSLDIVPTLDNILSILKEFTRLYPVINEGWQVDGEPARYDVDFVANAEYDFSLLDKINLEKIVGGGVKINSRKCLENWEEAYYSGDIYAGDTLFPFMFRRNPICDFMFNDTPYSNDVYANDSNYLANDIIKIKGG